MYDLTSICVLEEAGRIRVAVTPVVSAFESPETLRRLEFVLHRAAEPASVYLNGNPHHAYNWDADCTPETTPIGFSLKTSDDRPIAVGATNASGILKFTGLANGAYHLDETTGDWCHAEADRVDSAGNVLVANGGNTDVYIYNCSVKQVGALPSTGTGANAQGSGSTFDGDNVWQLLLAAGITLAIAFAVRHRLQRAVLHTTPLVDTPVLPQAADEHI